MQLWVYQTILAIGAVQGVVLGVMLWRNESRHKKANRWLGLILFFISYRLIAQILKSQGLITVDNFTYHIFLEYNWIYGPFLFFYVRAYLFPQKPFLRSDWSLFLPVGLQFIFSNFIKSQNFFWDGSRESLSWLGYYGYILWMHTPFMHVVAFLLIVYFSLCSRKLITKRSVRLPWLQHLLTAFIITGLLLPVIAVIDYLFYDYAFQPFYIYPLYIGMALLLYWLGLSGFIHRNDLLPPMIEGEKIDQWQQVAAKLVESVQTRKLYLNPTLSLEDAAKEISEQPYVVSQALNHHLGKNFTDFINEFRVKEFKQLIRSADHENFTLLAIAHEAGFNSKASFNRAVKKFTGKSPSQIRKDMLSNS